MSVSLYQASHFEEAWRGVLEQWFEKLATEAWKAERPVAAVVPSAAASAFLKKQILEAGLNTIGLSFYTPGALRDRLLRESPGMKSVAMREDLRLIMALAAERVAENPVATAVSRSPDEFVRILGILGCAGWGPEALAEQPLREIAEEYFACLEAFNLQTVELADHELWRKRDNEAPLFEEILLYGFSDWHWNLYALLGAGVDAARRAVFVLLEGGLTESSQVWLGTWEERYGPAEILADATASPKWPFREVAFNLENLLETGSGTDEGRGVTYRVANSILEEAEAIVAQALTFLGSESCERLGIVFPRGSALSREVSLKLTEYGIAHYDALGHFPGRERAQAAFEGWVRFQEEQLLDTFIDFVGVLSSRGKVTAETAETVRRVLMGAFNSVLTDDLDVLRAFVQEASVDDCTIAVLRAWPSLPKRGVFGEFFDKTRQAVGQLGWPKSWEAMENHSSRLKALSGEAPILRQSFLAWLREIARVPERTRPPLGRHPYAKVTLLALDEADGQEWSHVIAAGMSADMWSGEGRQTPFLDAEDLRCLNSRVVKTGSQGEGHLKASGRRGRLRNSSEEGIHTLIRLNRVMEVTREAIAVTFGRAKETDRTRVAVPSDWLLRLFWTERGRLLDDLELSRLADQTSAWLSTFHGRESDRSSLVAPTLEAYSQRRDGERPFGKYEFSYARPPEGGLKLTSTAWDEILKRPAKVWLNSIIKVSKRRYYSEGNFTHQMVGSWAHAWLRLDRTGGFVPMPDEKVWLQLVERSAKRTHSRVSQAYSSCGRALPDWWLAEWNEALRLAREAAVEVSHIGGWPAVASEFVLPSGSAAQLPAGEQISVRGRIDLLLSTDFEALAKTGDGWPADCRAWIIDLKTSRSALKITKKNFVRGNGLQLGLYALVLYGMGCRSLSVSLLRPGDRLSSQLELDSLREVADFWTGLAEMEHFGIVGQLGPMRSEHAYVGEYPLTSLPIDPGILEQKWRRTHPLLECK